MHAQRRPIPHVLSLFLTGALAACFGKGGGGAVDSAMDYGDCLDYIACSEAAGIPSATVTAEYGEGGTCWDGTADEQTLCRAACTDAMTSLAETYPGVDECNGGSASTDACSVPPDGTGYGEGDISYDFTLDDQDGNAVSLYDFCGDAVILFIAAGWDPASTASVSDARQWLDDYSDRGLAVLVLMGEDADNGPSTTAYDEEWATDNDLDTPVLNDPEWDVGWNYMSGSIPSFTLMKAGAEIVLVDQYPLDTSDIEAALP